MDINSINTIYTIKEVKKINKKTILVFCEFYVSFVSVGLLFLMIYILIFPMFINPNPEGIVKIYTNRNNELYLDWYLTIICLIFTIFSLSYIIYYRFKRIE